MTKRHQRRGGVTGGKIWYLGGATRCRSPPAQIRDVDRGVRHRHRQVDHQRRNVVSASVATSLARGPRTVVEKIYLFGGRSRSSDRSASQRPDAGVRHGHRHLVGRPACRFRTICRRWRTNGEFHVIGSLGEPNPPRRCRRTSRSISGRRLNYDAPHEPGLHWRRAWGSAVSFGGSLVVSSGMTDVGPTPGVHERLACCRSGTGFASRQRVGPAARARLPLAAPSLAPHCHVPTVMREPSRGI